MSSKIEDMFSGMSTDDKKKALGELTIALIKGLGEEERKQMLQSMLTNQKEDQRLSSIVDR